MALDPYAPCPAGTGKKLKFCCADLTGELEKIQRMVEGDQRLACLEYIEQLLTRYPGRACLLTTQAELLIALDRRDEAKTVLDSLLQVVPANPVGLAESSLLAMQEGKVSVAVEKLQRAVAFSPTPMPMAVAEVVAASAEALITLGYFPAGFRHLLMAASLLPQDQRVMRLLVELNASPHVPLMFKDEPDLQPAPDAAAWRGKFDEAIEPARRGAWQVAAEKLTALSQSVADSPALWHNLGLLRCWVTDHRGAADALRHFAALPVPADDAVEAEALAQLLEPDTNSPRVDLLSITYPVKDIDELVTKLSQPRFVTMTVDSRAWTEQNEAPPRFGYALLDRDPPPSGAGLAVDAVPNVLANLLVFGRQTDREARVEVSVARPNLAAVRAALDELCGALLGPAGEEHNRGEISANQYALSWNWRLPDDTPVADVHRLLVEQRRRAVLTRWVDTPAVALSGKTPAEAARDDKLRIPLQAAVLVLELSFSEPSVGDLFNDLRRQLGLPIPAAIDPQGVAVDRLPLARLHRVEWSKASDEQLMSANRRALFASASIALRKIALEVVSRTALKDKVPFDQIYGMLARLEDDSAAALGYLDKARAAAEASGKSTALWDLQELTLRLERGEPDEFARMLSHIQGEHLREPGVAQALGQILVEAGLMTPDGRMVRAPEEAAGLSAGAAAPEPGKIWTPESESGGKKSALWVPGSE